MPRSSHVKLIKPNISQPAINAVTGVLESGMLVSGPVVEQFEKKLAEYLNVPYACCVSSGTAALHLSLLVADIKPGDEVIVPAFTFPATANVVEMIGAVPVFVDCKPGGVNIDVDRITGSLTAKTRAIMPVHAFGIPADMEKIIELSRQKNLVIIEDAACALGSKYKDNHCGTFGDLAAFSFHPRKLLTTGEGGAVVTHDSVSAERIKSLRNHGWADGEYRHLGFNYRMTDFQAALGVNQVEYYDRRLTKRRYLADKYWEKIDGLGWLEPVKSSPEMKWNVQTLLALVDDGSKRDDLINYLKAGGIETTIGTYCVPLTAYYRLKYGYTVEEFPNAYDMFKRSISLPLYNELTERDIDMIFRTLQSFVSTHKPVKVAT